jgi:uncharacterized protein (TIGR02677 family)
VLRSLTHEDGPFVTDSTGTSTNTGEDALRAREPAALSAEQLANLTRRLSETAYLNTERTPYYRVIMRFFLDRAEAQVTWVKADEVLAHVRAVFDPNYDDLQRDRDLRTLTEWRNLLEVQDARGARTARDFRNRRPEYHIRADALRLERWVRTWESAASQGGSLDPSLLERLWHRLSDIYTLLLEAERGGDYVMSERAELLWPLWEDAHQYVATLNANTTGFHQSLAEARPTDITDTRAFDYYKQVLFTSLTNFINSLAERADRIQGRLADWEAAGLMARLRDHLVYHRQHRLLGAAETSPEAIQAWVAQQVAFVMLWFAPGGACDGVRRATRQAIATIGRHLGRLAEADAGGHSRAAELRDLACAFAATADIGTAHQLAVATFGAFWLRHYKTSSEAEPLTVTASPWQQVAYQYPIKKIRLGRQWAERDVSGIEDCTERQTALQAASARLRAEERSLLDGLFATGRVDLGALNELPPVARDRLLVAIRECLGAKDAASLALDGSHIVLHVPRVDSAGALRSSDGTLWTPRFTLSRHRPLEARDAARATGPASVAGGHAEEVVAL